MRLQKQLSRRIGNTEYAKFVIAIPSQVIKELDWEEGEELTFEIQEKKLVIKTN